MVIAVLAVVLIVVFVVAWGGLRQGGPDAAELDPHTSRREMDKQFKKPPNEGGLL
jgi:hypothetical protein